MKRSALVLITAMLLIPGLRAYNQVWNGDLVFTNQAEIDNFGFFSYTAVNGKLRINDAADGVHNITNLAGLAGLSTVSGAVEIQNNNLLPNTGYLNLTSIGSALITGNPALTTINGLAVANAPSAIVIRQNNALASVTGFNSVSTVGKLIIQNNPVLNNLTGFANLTKVNDSLSIVTNSSLASLNSFSQVSEVRFLLIQGNPLLANINGLGALTIVDDLNINNNAILQNVDGLINLTAANVVSIYDNPALLNVSGISNIAFTSSDVLAIATNNSLQTIAGPAGWTGFAILTIQQNGSLASISGFNGVQQVSTLNIINNPVLTSVSGFNQLDSVKQSIRVERNSTLTTLNAFPTLLYITGNLSLRENHVLSNIAPWPLLDSISGTFHLSLDSMLTNVDFVPNVKRIGGDVIISTCKRLANLNGFSHLASIGGLLLVEKCPQLASIAGLAALTRIPASLSIVESGVTNLNGLQNLVTVNGTFSITRNLQLTTLNALAKLDTVWGTLYISSNPLITNLNGVRNLRRAQGITIGDNASLTQFCGLYQVLTGSNPPGVVIGLNQANPTVQDIINAGPCTNAQLPVQLKLFNSNCENTKVVLTWITTGEYNNSHFAIQRSVDGTVWETLGTLPAAGGIGVDHKYNFTDITPMNNGFYRLAQHDLNGKVNYSTVIRSACTVREQLTLWPNPAQDKIVLTVRSLTASAGVLMIYDSKGIAVQSKNLILLPGINQVTASLQHLPAGTYLAVMVDGQGSRSKQFVKK